MKLFTFRIHSVGALPDFKLPQRLINNEDSEEQKGVTSFPFFNIMMVQVEVSCQLPSLPMMTHTWEVHLSPNAPHHWQSLQSFRLERRERNVFIVGESSSPSPFLREHLSYVALVDAFDNIVPFTEELRTSIPHLELEWTHRAEAEEALESPPKALVTSVRQIPLHRFQPIEGGKSVFGVLFTPSEGFSFPADQWPVPATIIVLRIKTDERSAEEEKEEEVYMEGSCRILNEERNILVVAGPPQTLLISSPSLGSFL